MDISETGTYANEDTYGGVAAYRDNLGNDIIAASWKLAQDSQGGISGFAAVWKDRRDLREFSRKKEDPRASEAAT